MGPNDPSQDEVLPLVEERFRLEKREVIKGKVRVRSATETVEEIARATLSEDTVDVTRIPVGTVVDQPPSVRTEGDLTIIPVLEEVLFVEKRLLLVEEIHIRRSTRSEEVSVPVSLRKQRAVIETAGAPAPKK